MANPILQMEHISKSFGTVSVLEDVSLFLYPGEVHALMGENGAGKSTLMKILMGMVTPDGGRITLEGKPYAPHSPHEALGAGVAMIHQELSPVLDMQVFENIFLGRYPTRGICVDRKGMIAQTKQWLDDMHIDISPTAYLRDCSVAQCQMVEIVKATSVGAKVVIMDEPTSALTDKETDMLFAQIARLKAQDVSIVYISHKMDEIFKVCDRITILRDGRQIRSEVTSYFTTDSIIRDMVGRELSDLFPKQTVPIGEVVLEARHLGDGSKVKDVSFTLRRGEIVGLAGLVGAGRSETAELLFGLRKQLSGELLLDGKALHVHSPQDAIAKGLAFLTEDRKQTGLNLLGTVQENATLAQLHKLFPRGIIDHKKEQTIAQNYVQTLSIKTPSAKQVVGRLSGGNQQKVVLAKWLCTDPSILILDEPTRGIDVAAKRDIYLLLGELVKAGKSILLISSEMPELMGLCDRIVVLAEGRTTGELSREDFCQEQLMAYATTFKGE